MIFANIDSTVTKNVIGFETGTRQLFDQRHGGDPLWLFVDYNNAKNRSDFVGFFKTPTNYYVDKNGNFRIRTT